MQLQSPHVEITGLRRARPLLGTRVEIAASGPAPDRDLHAAIDAAFARIDEVHGLMSYQDPLSDLSRLNRNALKSSQRVDPHTYVVCTAALHVARASEGAFDPTVASKLERCGLLPGSSRACDFSASWRDIELCGGSHIRFHRPLRVDLGGIAKGYAVDLAIRELQRFPVNDALVNAGGDLRVYGCAPTFTHIRHPGHPLQTAHTLALQDAALATSAAYYSRRADAQGEVSALIDARSGRPYVGGRSVSVRAGECMFADALTKVVLFASHAVAASCLAAHDADAFVLDCP